MLTYFYPITSLFLTFNLSLRAGTVHMVCRSKERGEKAQQDIIAQSSSDKVFLHLADVSSFADVRTLAKDFQKSGHHLDVLVNNAGFLPPQKLPPSKDGIEIVLATNLLGGFLLTNLLIPVLMKSPDPRVILISSGGGLTEKLTLRTAYDKIANQQPFDEALGRTLYALTKVRKYKPWFRSNFGFNFAAFF